MTELIVDFPDRSAKASINSVRFSASGKVRFYKRHHAYDVNELFYSEQECENMKAANRRAVRDARKRYASFVSGASTEDFDTCTLIGIEHLLSPNLIEQGMMAKKECRRAVFAEQSRQAQLGERDASKLASASRCQTKSSAKRAHLIGLLQAQQ